jgi:hypothetical protein
MLDIKDFEDLWGDIGKVGAGFRILEGQVLSLVLPNSHCKRGHYTFPVKSKIAASNCLTACSAPRLDTAVQQIYA